MEALGKRQRIVAVGSMLVTALAVDILTKWLILNVVMTPPRVIEITPFFNLVLGFNSGVSFGMFRDFFFERPFVLVGIKVAIIFALLVWAMRTDKRAEAVALGMIAGGATGNVVDRASRGAVTDFLDFHVGAWHWPAFNTADAAITIGVILLLASSIWATKTRTTRSSATSKIATR